MTNANAHTGAKNSTPDKLTQISAISYALPAMTSSMLITPFAIIQGIYAKHYGIALSTLALIIVASRIFDAVSDPVVGYLSDRYRQKQGTRKPFMVVGTLLMLACCYFIYVPGEQISTAYIAVFFMLLSVVYTLFEIPHLSWPCDIASESADRAKLYTYRMVAGYAGMIAFYSIPLLPIFPTKEITPQTLKVAFFFALCLALPFLFQAMKAVPAGNPPSPVVTTSKQSKWQMLKQLLQDLFNNKPFLIFVGVFLCTYCASGIWFGLIFIYVDAYLGMGDQFAQMFLIAFVVGIAMTPLWYHTILKVGNKTAFFIVMLLFITCYLFTGTLSPGETSFSELLLLKIIQTSAFVGSGVVVPTMLAEIVDYDHWKSGVEKSATYFSVKVFSEKTAAAVGTGFGLAIVGWSGFVVSATSFTPEAINGLKLSIAIIPAALAGLACVFVVLTPISARRHRIIKKRLDLRLKRSLESGSNTEVKKSSGDNLEEVPLSAS